MTEGEWLACEGPERMLKCLYAPGGPARTRAGHRKLRLFTSACLRRLWRRVTDPRCREAVEVAERYADGLATRQALRARGRSSPPGRGPGGWSERAWR
jgi:hypothetical protein